MYKKSSEEKYELKYFGTDGFRGEYGKELTDTHAEAIGRFLGVYYGDGGAEILIGRDTRRSSPLLESALVRGITSVGGSAFRLGVCPTPAVSFLTKHGGADASVMITASHNPAGDNGIKLFGKNGEKLPDDITALCEEYIDSHREVEEKKGMIVNVPHVIFLWRRWLTSSVGSLKGVKIGLDCANGATYDVAPRIFKELGAEVYTIGCEPNGENINLGVGSTRPEALSKMVKEHSLDMGFAFDGDGDRCIAVDHQGEIIDGDCEMFILARAMKEKGGLQGDTVVCTVMSNGGFIRSLEKIGIKCITTAVGDRFVAEKMKEEGASLGGEQSGHLIFEGGGGDGIYTALKIAQEVVRSGKGLRELGDGITRFPQLSRSIRVKDKVMVMNDKELLNTVTSLSEEMGASGRILLRPSGTEGLIRLMVEHEKQEKCKQYLELIGNMIEERWSSDSDGN